MLIVYNSEIFSKKLLTFGFCCTKIVTNLNITNNDYDEDGRKFKLYRELSFGARQQRIFSMTYHF